MSFAAVFLVVNLHLLRNVTPGYLALYTLVSLWVIIELVLGSKCQRKYFSATPVVWVAIAIFGFAVTATLSGVSAAAFGLSRFLFSFPVFLAFVCYTHSKADLVSHIRFMVGFMVVAALTVPMQFVTGPIPWFASASERGGLERYASLVGSLTALGIIAGSYIVLLQLHKVSRRLPYMVFFIMSVAATLSKAAIANCALGLVCIVYVSRREIGRTIVALIATAAMLGVAVAAVPAVRERAATTLGSFGVQSAETLSTKNNDATAQQSAISRVTELPRKNYEALGQFDSYMVYLTGGGFGMASTALVPKAASLGPMAHNQFAELVTVFGFLAGVFLILVLIGLQVVLLRRARREEGRLAGAVAAAFGLFMVNSMFANGTVYQPASASIFFLGMFVAGAKMSLSDDEDDYADAPSTDKPPKVTGAMSRSF